MDKILDELIKRYPILSSCQDEIYSGYQTIADAFTRGHKLLVAGNGGSAADAEHIVGELMKGFKKMRPLTQNEKVLLNSADSEMGAVLSEGLQSALPAISLVGHPGLSTAFLNDVDPLLGFAQQVYGFGKQGDVFLGITTSGNSQNILYAAVAAKAKGMKVVILTGRDGGKAKKYGDVAIIVEEKETYRIQELHLPIYHAICLMLENHFFEN